MTGEWLLDISVLPGFTAVDPGSPAVLMNAALLLGAEADEESCRRLVDGAVDQIHAARWEAGLLRIATMAIGTGTPEDPISVLTLTIGMVRSRQPNDMAGGERIALDGLRAVLRDRAIVRQISADRFLRTRSFTIVIAPPDSDVRAAVSVSATDPARDRVAETCARAMASTVRLVATDSA